MTQPSTKSPSARRISKPTLTTTLKIIAGTAIRREPQREVHDARHELRDGFESVLEALAPASAGSAEAGGADQDREQDQRQHVAEYDCADCRRTRRTGCAA